jgi:hypothetical protein
MSDKPPPPSTPDLEPAEPGMLAAVPAGPDALNTFGARSARHALLYGAAMATVPVAGLVTVSILTRRLGPAEFGELGILTVFAGLLTTLYNLGSLQGAIRVVFGASMDEGGGDAASDEAASDLSAPLRRRMLGSALSYTLLLGLLGAALVWCFSESTRPVPSCGPP